MSAIDHRQIIAQLPDGERARLTRLANRPGLVRLAVQLALIVGLGSFIVARAPGWPLALPVQGIVIIFLFCAMHEAVHETAFASRRLNRVVGWICGFAVGIAPTWFTYFHLAHHRHTHDRERDPELAISKPHTLTQYLVYLSGLPAWWGNARALAANALGRSHEPFVPERGRAKVIAEARLFLSLYAALALASFAFSSTLLVWAWLVPVLLGQPFLRAYLLAEHARCAHVANMLHNTRTTFTTAIVRWIAWNMPYHTEHHVHPGVPFHLLPAFHKIMRDRLVVTERGYARFHSKLIAEMV